MINNPEKSKVVGKIAYARWPKGPTGKRVTSIWNWGFPINAALTDKQKKATWLFITWAASAETQARTSWKFAGPAKRSGVNRMSLWHSPEFAAAMKDAGDNFIPAALESLEQDTDVDWRPRVPQWPAIGETMATAIQAALVGQKKPKEALDEAQARIAADPEGLSGAMAVAMRRRAPSLAAQERRFALALLVPALAVLRADDDRAARLPRLEQPAPPRPRHAVAVGLRRLDNYAKMGSDPRFWNSLVLTVDLHRVDGRAAGASIGLSLALLVLQIPKGQGVLRVAAILPIVLAPVVVGLFWRTLVLAPDFGLVDLVTRALGLGSHNWLGDPQLALISVIAIHTWQWTPFAFLVLLATLVDAAARRLRGRAARPRRRLAALPPHHAAADPAGDRDGRDPAHDDRAVGLRGDLRGHRRRARDRRPRSSTSTPTARRSPS